ncbi:MAG: hypothetical protein V7742_21605 [Halioglobus sp.]
MKRKVNALLWLFVIMLMQGCASADDPGKYRVATIGNAQRSVEGVVLFASEVWVQESSTGTGAARGGLLAGAVAAESSDNAAVIIAGIIAGSIVGDAIERDANTFSGMEYLMETSVGLLLTVVQVNKGSEIFNPGDKVILVYGYPTRLVRDPR